MSCPLYTLLQFFFAATPCIWCTFFHATICDTQILCIFLFFSFMCVKESWNCHNRNAQCRINSAFTYIMYIVYRMTYNKYYIMNVVQHAPMIYRVTEDAWSHNRPARCNARATKIIPSTFCCKYEIYGIFRVCLVYVWCWCALQCHLLQTNQQPATKYCLYAKKKNTKMAVALFVLLSLSFADPDAHCTLHIYMYSVYVYVLYNVYSFYFNGSLHGISLPMVSSLALVFYFFFVCLFVCCCHRCCCCGCRFDFDCVCVCFIFFCLPFFP